MNISLKHTALILISLACAILLLSRFHIFIDTAKNIYGVLTTSFEERKASAYEDLEYGYIKYVYDKLPDKSIFPTTRYPLYLQNTKILFSDELILTKDILLTLDMEQVDFETSVIGNADLVSDNSWTLQTYFDYDTFEGLRLMTEECSEDNIQLNITMYSTVSSLEPMATTTKSIGCVEDQPVDILLDEAIQNFSFGRGTSAFKFIIESDSIISWKKVEALGIRVNVDEHKLVNKDVKNSTYLKKDFLDYLIKNNDEGWVKFLNEITNV